jgi:hypothetical protein
VLRHRSTPLQRAILIAATLLLGGCTTAAEMDIMIQESPKGAVYIERIPDTKFQAAHPIKLDYEVIARTLRGLYVREDRSTLQTIFASASETGVVRPFSDEDVDYLAPLIAAGLSQAAADQRIGFRVTRQAPLITRSKMGGAAIGSSDPIPGTGTETTEANLYAYGTSLHLTLTKYRLRPDRPDTINMPNRRLPDDTGLKLTEVFFYPPEARRPESYQPSKLLGEPLLTTLVIDYQLLAKLPSSRLTPPLPPEQPRTTTPVGAPPSAEDRPPAPTAATTEDQQAAKQLQSIKAEMEELRQQMQKQQEEMEKMKEQSKDR